MLDELDLNLSIMQKLREESGLLAAKGEEKSAGKSRSDSVDSTSTSASNSASNKKGKSSKKDKLKSKREAKRLKAVLAEQDSENALGGKEESEGRKKTPKNQKKLIYRMKDIEKCAAAVDILAMSDSGDPVWNMKPTRFDFDHLENEEDRDLYVPDIHTIANTPTRICLSLPVPKGNQDKDKAHMRAKSSSIDSNLSGDLDSRYIELIICHHSNLLFFYLFFFEISQIFISKIKTLQSPG